VAGADPPSKVTSSMRSRGSAGAPHDELAGLLTTPPEHVGGEGGKEPAAGSLLRRHRERGLLEQGWKECRRPQLDSAAGARGGGALLAMLLRGGDEAEGRRCRAGAIDPPLWRTGEVSVDRGEGGPARRWRSWVRRAGGDPGCDAVDVGKKQSREGTGTKV
jgi:hypothetical protein